MSGASWTLGAIGVGLAIGLCVSVRVAPFDHDPMRLLEPLADHRLPPEALAFGEHYLLLDARVDYSADLAVVPLEPVLGRALLALERDGVSPREDELARLAAAGLVVGASESVPI